MERRKGNAPPRNLSQETQRNTHTMSMKNPTSPRRIYSTRGTMVFLFKGKRYCPAGESAFVTKAPCTVVEEHKDGSLTVKQRLPKKAGITEVWVEFAELPRQCKDELGRVRVKTHGEGMIPRQVRDISHQRTRKLSKRKKDIHMSENTNENKATEAASTSETTDVVDAALKAALARKAAKAAGGAKTAAPSAKPAKATDAEREAKKAQIEADRKARKEAKEAERAEKLALAQANRKPAHMSKVEKAAERLPRLEGTAEHLFTDATANLSRDQVTALALHLQHFNRAQATERALTAKLEVGANVRITGGDPRFIGLTGELSKVQRIRCYCTVPGLDRDVYLFTSDVTVIEEDSESETVENTGTDGLEIGELVNEIAC